MKTKWIIMEKQNEIKVFEDKQVRSVWDEDKEKWYFSIIDVIEILTESPRPRKYWNALKTKLKAEGSQLSLNVGQLKIEASDGKKYLTDVADTEQLFRLIQSIPSPKAEPFKLWLAQVASEWSVFKHKPADEMLLHVQTKVFPFLKDLNGETSPFTKHMANAVFIMPKASLLVSAINIVEDLFKEIEKDATEGGHAFQDIQGDVYEMLLSEIAGAYQYILTDLVRQKRQKEIREG